MQSVISSVLGLAKGLNLALSGQISRKLILAIFAATQLRIFLHDVLSKYNIVFGAGIVEQVVISEIDAFLEEGVGGIGLDFADDAVGLASD